MIYAFLTIPADYSFEHFPQIWSLTRVCEFDWIPAHILCSYAVLLTDYSQDGAVKLYFEEKS